MVYRKLRWLLAQIENVHGILAAAASRCTSHHLDHLFQLISQVHVYYTTQKFCMVETVTLWSRAGRWPLTGTGRNSLNWLEKSEKMTDKGKLLPRYILFVADEHPHQLLYCNYPWRGTLLVVDVDSDLCFVRYWNCCGGWRTFLSWVEKWLN